MAPTPSPPSKPPGGSVHSMIASNCLDNHSQHRFVLAFIMPFRAKQVCSCCKCECKFWRGCTGRAEDALLACRLMVCAYCHLIQQPHKRKHSTCMRPSMPGADMSARLSVQESMQSNQAMATAWLRVLLKVLHILGAILKQA